MGVVCKCGCQDHFWIKRKWSCECARSLEKESLSEAALSCKVLIYLSCLWHKTMFLMTGTKKGFSSKEIQKPLELKRYEPVWAMGHTL